jgi:hypothetical protein
MDGHPAAKLDTCQVYGLRSHFRSSEQTARSQKRRELRALLIHPGYARCAVLLSRPGDLIPVTGTPGPRPGGTQRRRRSAQPPTPPLGGTGLQNVGRLSCGVQVHPHRGDLQHQLNPEHKPDSKAGWTQLRGLAKRTSDPQRALALASHILRRLAPAVHGDSSAVLATWRQPPHPPQPPPQPPSRPSPESFPASQVSPRRR